MRLTFLPFTYVCTSRERLEAYQTNYYVYKQMHMHEYTSDTYLHTVCEYRSCMDACRCQTLQHSTHETSIKTYIIHALWTILDVATVLQIHTVHSVYMRIGICWTTYNVFTRRDCVDWDRLPLQPRNKHLQRNRVSRLF